MEVITDQVDEGLETLGSNKRKIDGPVLVVAGVVAFEALPEGIGPLLRSLLVNK